MSRKIRRFGFYDYEEKNWKTFYHTKSGELKLSKGMSYKNLRKEISKNPTPLKTDIISKENSLLTNIELQREKVFQSQINNAIKRKKVSQEIYDKANEINFKQNKVLQIISEKKVPIKKEKSDNFVLLPLNFVAINTSSPHFFVQENSFDNLQKMTASFIKQYKRFKITLLNAHDDDTDEPISGFVSEIAFLNSSAFESALSNIIQNHPISYHKEIWEKKKNSIKIEGIL